MLSLDGNISEVEVFTREMLADREPSSGADYTPFAEMLKMMEPTHRLI
jgi:hypothetical protein